MKSKKAFTITEILLVLLVIGFIAAFAVPMLMGAVLTSQWQAGYKKAFSNVLNASNIDRALGIELIPDGGRDNVKDFYRVLNNNLSINGYILDYSDGGSFVHDGSYVGTDFSTSAPDPSRLSADETPWIIGDDKFAYKIMKGGSCGTKAAINAKKDHAGAVSVSCAVVGVDVNGLYTGPNAVDSQVTKSGGIDKNEPMSRFFGERFYIYIGSDGATPGNNETFVTGRIVSNLK